MNEEPINLLVNEVMKSINLGWDAVFFFFFSGIDEHLNL